MLQLQKKLILMWIVFTVINLIYISVIIILILQSDEIMLGSDIVHWLNFSNTNIKQLFNHRNIINVLPCFILVFAIVCFFYIIFFYFILSTKFSLSTTTSSTHGLSDVDLEYNKL